MEELLKQRDKMLALDFITDEQWAKLKGETKPGNKVQIIWKDWGKDYPENGYIFTLPMCSYDEADVFVHILEPRSLDGKDRPDEVYLHIQDLMTNEMVESIVCSEK
jgi:hypothetical protein